MSHSNSSEQQLLEPAFVEVYLPQISEQSSAVSQSPDQCAIQVHIKGLRRWVVITSRIWSPRGWALAAQWQNQATNVTIWTIH